jgi:hypothetical protein
MSLCIFVFLPYILNNSCRAYLVNCVLFVLFTVLFSYFIVQLSTIVVVYLDTIRTYAPKCERIFWIRIFWIFGSFRSMESLIICTLPLTLYRLNYQPIITILNFSNKSSPNGFVKMSAIWSLVPIAWIVISPSWTASLK